MNELLVRLGLRRAGKSPEVVADHHDPEDRAAAESLRAAAPEFYTFAPLEMTPERRKIVNAAPINKALIDELTGRRTDGS